ncbi:MAG: ABC transporter permease [Acidobacteria bacterium]|nr:ABC transporter permease [Acidobacteriota bacterium]
MKESLVHRLRQELQEMVHEQAEYRSLLFQITIRDLLLRYKQTVMGVGWAVFMPLVNAVVFWVIFTKVTQLDTGGVPYLVFAFCGLLAWNFLASSLRFSAICLTSNTTLVTKVYFPREIFPFSAVLVGLVDFAVASTVMIALMAFYGIGVSWTLVLLPVVFVTHVAFTAACALILAMGNLFYRDVKYIFEIVLTVWMFATSVVYPVSHVAGRLGAFLALNPMTAIIDAYRDVLLYQQVPAAVPFGSAMLASFGLFGVSWLVFHRAEFAFAENI